MTKEIFTYISNNLYRNVVFVQIFISFSFLQLQLNDKIYFWGHFHHMVGKNFKTIDNVDLNVFYL